MCSGVPFRRVSTFSRCTRRYLRGRFGTVYGLFGSCPVLMVLFDGVVRLRCGMFYRTSSRSVSLETITVGDTRVVINANLEEKDAAWNLLSCLLAELKEHFYGWIDQVSHILMPLLDYNLDNKQPRRAAASALPELLLSAKLAMEKAMTPTREASYLNGLLDTLVMTLVRTLRKEADKETCAILLKAVNRCIQISGTLLTENHVRCIVNEIKLVITASSNRIREGEQAVRARAEDLDAEERELLKEKHEQEEKEIFQQVGEVLVSLIKTFKASFLPCFDELSFCLTPMWDEYKSPDERILAMGIFNYVAEHCPEAVLIASNDRNPHLCEAALYVLGRCAEFGGSAFTPFIGAALSKLSAVIKDRNVLLPENVAAYRMAVSSLEKICWFHRDGMDDSQRRLSFYLFQESSRMR